MESSDTIAARILSILNESSSHTVRGAALRELLKHRYPDFSAADYQCKNLRHFIYKYVPLVIALGPLP